MTWNANYFFKRERKITNSQYFIFSLERWSQVSCFWRHYLSLYWFLYLIPFINQTLESTEEGLISTNGHQDIFERVDVLSHNPTKEFSQTFNKRGVTLRKEYSKKAIHYLLCNYFNFICPFNPSEKWLKWGPPLGCLCAYKSSGVLVHLRSSADGLAEGLLDKLWRGEVRKSLAEVHYFVICCELCELNPVGVRWVRQSNDVTRCVSKNETIRGFVPFQFISVKKIVDFKLF